MHRPWFLAAIGLNVAGCALQIMALRFGSLALVQPLLVLSLLFAVVIASLVIRRRPPDAVLLAGVACCAVGIAGFLVVGRPHGGMGTADPAAALPLAAGLATVLAGCLAAARWGPVALRPLRQWPLYLVVIVTPVGFLLNQSAFQAGTPIAPALAVITTADPLVSMGAGAAFLHEQMAAGPADLAAEALALAVAIAGVIALARRAPQAAGTGGSPSMAEAVSHRHLARAEAGHGRPRRGAITHHTPCRPVRPAA